MDSPKRKTASAAADPGSPVRTSKVEKRFTVTHLDQRAYDELQLALKAAVIDNEHQQSVVSALDAKLQAYGDLQNDVARYTQALKESEGARGELQITLTTTADKLAEDTKSKEMF